MKRNTTLLLLITTLIVTLSCNKEYILINNYTSNSENEILSFSLKKGSFIKDFEISENSILGLIPNHIELDGFELEITISEKATISPDPKSITRIDKPLTFVVTAENGATKTYNIDIKRELSDEKEIISFFIRKDSFTQEFEILENSITGFTPSYIELSDIELEITISDNATISPDPKSITKIDKLLTFIVTAENSTTKTYNIDIRRELSKKNDIISFKIKTTDQTLEASIDNIENKITKKLPTFLNLSNLTTEVNISEKASISPLPIDITDYSSPVNFTVKAENGVEKTYTVTLEHISNSFSNTCNQSNASKWFGGDSRTNAPDISPYDRNVGTGQSVLFQNDTELSSFSIKLESGFKHHETGAPHNETVKLNLDIRNTRGEIISSTITELDSTFLGGWVDFDLSDLQLFFEANTEYIFTWYLIDGANLGVDTGSSAYIDSGNGFCFGQGYSGQSNISLNNNLKNWNTWIKHEWYFNIKLQGKH
ncbi:DUF5018 domain-containing protein [Tenacibaculum sp. Ill]|uniref:DUF5018 domain-containing protein n=1 Tax=Tenacibaculum sp. Ill TaxID=3445935 RepID=UPI003F7940A5